MALAGKFQRPATGGGKPVRKSRYAGIKAAAPRDPMPHVGEYVFRVLEIEEGHNPGKGTDSYKVKLEIVQCDETALKSHNVGDVVTMIQLVSGAGAQAGLGRTKSFVMAAAGFESEDDYDAFDPDGLFIDATTGASNDYTERATLIGRLVACNVTRGNATPDGNDYYREFAWAVVPDDGEEPTQDLVPSVQAQAAA